MSLKKNKWEPLLIPSVILSLMFMVQCKKSEQKMNEEPLVAMEVSERGESVIKSIFHPLSGIQLDSTKIEGFLIDHPDFKKYEQDFYEFYGHRHYNYAWFDQQGMIEQTMVLYHHLQSEDDDGIAVEIPYEEKLKALLESVSEGDNDQPDENTLDTELMLTGQYFVYANRKIEGSEALATEKMDWYLPKKNLKYAELLEQIVEGKDVEQVEGAVMQNQYGQLKQALRDYREILPGDTLGNIDMLTKPKVLKPGDSSSVLPKIKGKLAMIKMFRDQDRTNHYNEELAEAVKLFKTTHGLKGDSLITNEMIEQLNVPVEQRIEQLVTNMERFRWVPAGFSHDEFILVNIPEFQLHYYENKKEVWNCNVVVGKPMTNTVIFSGEMQYVVMSPYWNIPTSIINKEVKPGIKRDPNYLAKHNMDWNGGNVRQKPGPSNSLGRVKFIFPNSNNIYLHDTPAKRLFNEDQRAFSHGCVRVGEPRELAIRVLKQDSTWTPSKIDAAMSNSYETTVVLKKRIPVYIGYFTAFFDKNGHLNFRNDVYHRDNRLLKMITSSS